MSRIAIISDLHIGVHKSDEKYLKWALDYSEKLDVLLKRANVKTLFVLGDIFHTRKEVTTSALETAKRFFSNLVDYDIKMLCGNHDCFYDNVCDTTSISVFSNWKNIEVITTPKVIEVDEKKFLFVPWGVDPSTLSGRYDAVFGHFEITTFNMTQGQICENGVSSESVLNLSDTVFSGHFHLRCERNYDNNRKIVYVGSNMEHDWGDYGSKKGVYIYETKSGKYAFVENTWSPKHVLVEYTDSQEELEKSMSAVKGNIVKLVGTNYNGSVTSENLSRCVSTVTDNAPGAFTCEITSVVEQIDNESIGKIESVDPCESLCEYASKVTEKHEYDEISKILVSIYKQVKK